MKQLDLGELNDPVLIFGGPYSNLQATRCVLDAAAKLAIPADHVICTGDIVAYCANPVETISAIRDFGCAVVSGNCEQQLAAYQEDCGCGFDEGTVCDRLSASWYAYANRSVGAADRDWMADLPDLISFTHQKRRYVVVHGGLSDVSRFIWSCSADSVLSEEIDLVRGLVPDVDCVIAGHSGIPFNRRILGVDWINAGVVGMPAHDGSTETCFARLSENKITFHHLAYDHVAANKAMQAAGLTQGYDQALLDGYWPSEDVLPEELRVSG